MPRKFPDKYLLDMVLAGQKIRYPTIAVPGIGTGIAAMEGTITPILAGVEILFPLASCLAKILVTWLSRITMSKAVIPNTKPTR